MEIIIDSHVSGPANYKTVDDLRRMRISRPSNLTVCKKSLLHVSCTAKGEAVTKMDERILSRLRIKVLVL